jgi:hypothetical protein
LHPIAIGEERRVGRIDLRVEDYHPQQSVLKPQAGQRQTACIRYISAAPHRSQIILSLVGAATLTDEMGRTGEAGADASLRAEEGESGSAMRAIIARHLGLVAAV